MGVYFSCCLSQVKEISRTGLTEEECINNVLKELINIRKGDYLVKDNYIILDGKTKYIYNITKGNTTFVCKAFYIDWDKY